MVVGYRQHVNDVIGNEIRDVVREARDGRTPDVELWRESVDSASGSWPLCNGLDRRIDRAEEGEPKSGPSVLVPARCVGKL